MTQAPIGQRPPAAGLQVLAVALLTAGLSGCAVLAPQSASRDALPTLQTWDWNGGSGRPTLDAMLGEPSSWRDIHGAPPIDAPPTAYDLDGDGVDEIVAHGNDTRVHVFRLGDGRELAALATTIPPHWYVERVLNGVAAGVLRPGEAPTLIVSNSAAYVAAWRVAPAQSSTDALAFEKLWEQRLNGCHPTPSMDAAVALAPMPDGSMAIVAQTEESGLYAMDASGREVWRQCLGGGNAAPTIADLDQDGRPEAVFGSDQGIVTVVDAATGAIAWRFDATRHGVWPGSISVSPTVADLDGLAPLEVLFTARHAWNADASAFGQMHMAVFAVRAPFLVVTNGTAGATGELVWKLQPNWANPLSYTRLVATDADADGATDIFGMDWNTIGHYPGNWESTGNRSHVFRLDAMGREVWHQDLPAWWSNKDIAVGDFDGDGAAEVLANQPRLGDDGFARLDAATGAIEGTLSFTGWRVLRGPVLADIHHTGTPQLLASLESLEGGRGAIAVVDFGVARLGGAM